MNPDDLLLTAHELDVLSACLFAAAAGTTVGWLLSLLVLAIRGAWESIEAHMDDVAAKVPDGHRSTYVPRLNGAPGYQASCALCPCLNEQPPSLWFDTSEEATAEARDQLIFNENGPRQ